MVKLLIVCLMMTVCIALMVCAIFWLIAPRSRGAAFVDWWGGVVERLIWGAGK